MALAGHQFGQRPSSLLGVDDDSLALDFDMAATLKLQEWQDEREAERWKATVQTTYGSN